MATLTPFFARLAAREGPACPVPIIIASNFIGGLFFDF
jgi:hypothetical protein